MGEEQAEKGAGKLSHLDERGRARMVDVGAKDVTRREARAEAYVKMNAQTLELVTAGGLPKGDVFSTARIAGVMAAKKTSELIPLCHPLRIDSIRVEFEVNREASAVRIESCVVATDRTGVEMEALTAAALAALTVYDMCKAVEKGIEIESVRLLHKSGGKSGTWSPEQEAGKPEARDE
ncbi:MAG: cyclic pyranopterin monophosphate synthase MoaC [Candidatus Geothermincolia bacterium]